MQYHATNHCATFSIAALAPTARITVGIGFEMALGAHEGRMGVATPSQADGLQVAGGCFGGARGPGGKAEADGMRGLNWGVGQNTLVVS